MYTLCILHQNGHISKHDVDSANEIKALFDLNKGSSFKLYQRDTDTYFSAEYVRKLLKQ